MTDLIKALDRYLAVRRALGFKLKSQEARLRRFVAFMEARQAENITSHLAVEWAGSQCGPATWSSRLATVRSFARHVALSEPRTEVPPFGVFPPQRRPRPHIYSHAEVANLLATMPVLHPGGLQGRTYQCFFGVLASTGLRFSEAAHLRRPDVDLCEGLLHIRGGKSGGSRLVPLHPSTTAVLQAYAEERDRCPIRRGCDFFFTGARGAGVCHSKAHRAFLVWARQAGLRGAGGRGGPRIHDLRHTFAVRTLLRWYEVGEEVERRLPELTTYLGHRHIRDTYWYLSACPDLLDHARQRLEARWEAAA